MAPKNNTRYVPFDFENTKQIPNVAAKESKKSNPWVADSNQVAIDVPKETTSIIDAFSPEIQHPILVPMKPTTSHPTVSSSTLSASSSSIFSNVSSTPSSISHVSSVKHTAAPKKAKRFIPLNLDKTQQGPNMATKSTPSSSSASALDTHQGLTMVPKKTATQTQKPIIEFQRSTSSKSDFDTMFPSITGHAVDLVNRYNKDHYRCSKETMYREVKPHLFGKGNHKLALVGTIKLHGAHADIVVNFDNTFRIQSRKQHSVSVDKDVHGVAAHLLPLRTEIIELRDRFVARYQELNPNSVIDPTYPVIIAGEWVGPGIQPTVALDQLRKKTFVIIGANINKSWVNDMDYGHIDYQNLGIFNISRGKFYEVTMKIDDWEPCVEEMMRLTLEVERECPFAKTFLDKNGKFISGIGEGIVWKAVGKEGGSPRFWLKTKGPLHREVDVEKLPPLLPPSSISASDSTSSPAQIPGQAHVNAAKQFAEATVTEERLSKAWAAIQEMCIMKGLKFDHSRTGEFMQWLVKDIETEEFMEIRARGVDGELLKKEIGALGKKWFKERMKLPLKV